VGSHKTVAEHKGIAHPKNDNANNTSSEEIVINSGISFSNSLPTETTGQEEEMRERNDNETGTALPVAGNEDDDLQILHESEGIRAEGAVAARLMALLDSSQQQMTKVEVDQK
jgi:hypothetical protein